MSLAQTYTTTSSGSAGLVFVYVLVIFAIAIIPMWVIFTKAGQDGWKAIIPIYSTVIVLRIVGRSPWWLLWLLFPIVFLIVIYYDLSKSFGHGVGFTLGLIFLSLIFFYILAFGSSTYRGPSGPYRHAGVAAAPPPPTPPMPTA